MARTARPKWERDELILGLELYFRERPRLPDDSAPAVVEVSTLLRSLRPELSKLDQGYRNPNGVAMKVGNFAALDPLYTSDGRAGLKSGGRLDKEIWEEFSADSTRLVHTAQQIRSIAASGAALTGETDGDQNTAEAIEGRLITAIHQRRERDARVAKSKKAAAVRSGVLKCEVCGFDPALAFDTDRAQAGIECHHIKPLSELDGETKTKATDLALVCANCHRAIHAKRPWLTIEQLKAVVKKPSSSR